MPNWDKKYYQTLEEKFKGITENLDDRLDSVVSGRVAPALEDIAIGSARKMRAATLYFDIRDFSSRTLSPDDITLKKALLMLDCVIPMIMNIIVDNDGYIEKNTGDGVMAIVNAEGSDYDAANSALNIATTSFYVLRNMINPFLEKNSIPSVDARIGIDLGTLLLSRIGIPNGSSKYDRNFLTAVGASANLACRLQTMAGTNEIWVSDNIKQNAESYRQEYFIDKTPYDWTWTYYNNPGKTYKIWHYNAIRATPQ